MVLTVPPPGDVIGCRGDREIVSASRYRAGNRREGERMRRVGVVRVMCRGARQGPGTMSDYTGVAGEAQSVMHPAVPAASLCLRSTSWTKAALNLRSPLHKGKGGGSVAGIAPLGGRYGPLG